MKKDIILFVTLLSLLVTSTSAWILNESNKDGTTLEIQYYGIGVTDNINLSLVVKKYVTSTATAIVSESTPLEINNLVPGDSVRFQILISNPSSEPQSVRLLMTNLTCSSTDENVVADELLDYLYLIVTPGSKYADSTDVDTKIPKTLIVKLSDIITTSGTSNFATIYGQTGNELIVPCTLVDEYATLECRLWFDTSAEDCENISLNINKFVIGV